MQAYELIYGFKDMNDVYFKSEVFGMNFDAEMLTDDDFPTCLAPRSNETETSSITIQL